jgi:hypothetical protein
MRVNPTILFFFISFDSRIAYHWLGIMSSPENHFP